MDGLTCARCSKPGDQLKAPPFPTDLGGRIYDSVCITCWQEWLKEQTAIINHYGLNLLDPKSKTFLFEQTEKFLFGADEPA